MHPTDARPLVLQFADDNDAFHEDAKPGDLSLQFPIRWRSSSNQLVTITNGVPSLRRTLCLRPNGGPLPRQITYQRSDGRPQTRSHHRDGYQIAGIEDPGV